MATPPQAEWFRHLLQPATHSCWTEWPDALRGMRRDRRPAGESPSLCMAIGLSRPLPHAHCRVIRHFAMVRYKDVPTCPTPNHSSKLLSVVSADPYAEESSGCASVADRMLLDHLVNVIQFRVAVASHTDRCIHRIQCGSDIATELRKGGAVLPSFAGNPRTGVTEVQARHAQLMRTKVVQRFIIGDDSSPAR